MSRMVARLRNGWHPYPVFAALGVLSAAYFAITGTVWAVTGEFTRLGGDALEVVGVDVSGWTYFSGVVHLQGNPLTRTDGWIVIAMLLGSLLAALATDEFRWRVPRLRRRFVQCFAGGIVAGFGARLALGCNLAAMFTGVPQFSFHAWIFTVATAAGTWVGVRVIRQPWWRGPVAPVRALRPVATSDAATAPAGGVRRRRLRVFVAGAVGVAVVALVVGYAATGNDMLAVAVGFGAAFGVLIQRGQICFTAAFRDMWLTGRTALANALVLGLGVATVATFIVIEVGHKTPAIKPAGFGTLIGGLLFGVGIVLAGACETGMMYRAMEGQVQAWFAFAGNIVGATVLAYSWDHLGVYDGLVKGAPQIDLLSSWGPTGALLGTLAALAAWYAAMRRRDNRTRPRAVATGVTTQPAPVEG